MKIYSKNFKKGFTPTFSKPKFTTGFTIAEVLVVIAIMTILTTLVLASINASKKQSRDQKRVADITSVQLALEQFYARKKYYPKTLNDIIPQYLPSIPSSDVKYVSLNTITPGRCSSYHLYTTLESRISVLDSKKGFNSLSALICTGSSPNTGVNASTSPLIYDVTP